MTERGRDGRDGRKGDPGVNGLPGQDGKDGRDGRDGKDATYTSALRLGFVGTEEEWLKSLKGETGNKGEPGPKGDKGDKGDRGDRGPEGKEGPRGKDGTDGQDGQDGKDGRTILSGNGPPDSGAGSVGDFYIDIAALYLYGPKTEAGWGIGVRLRGRNVGSMGGGVPPSTGGTGGGGTWGSIIGTLADQLDLQAALDALDVEIAGKQAALGFTPVPNTRTVAGHALSADVTLAKADVGLANVDNTSDANKPVSTAQAAADAVVLSAAATAAGIADAAILASANAHAESLVVGLWDDRGTFDASGNAFPSSGGSGTAGAILKGDIWTISVAGTLGGHVVAVSDTVRALVDSPGSTDANWAIGEGNAGYVPENAANKNATGGYVGLSGFAVQMKNALGTIVSLMTNANTAIRTYIWPDKDGTVAMVSDITAAAVGLGSVTNDAQTKAAIVPNTAPAAGEVLIGNAGGTAYAKQAVSGDVSMTSAGVATVTGLAGDVAGSDHLLTRVMVKDTGATFLDKGNSGTSTQTLDYTAGHHQKITCTGAHTIATSNWPPTGNLGELLLELVNGAANTITWPTVNWVKPDGTFTSTLSTYLAAAGISLQSSGTDFILLWSRDAGTTVYGKFVR